MLLRLLFSPQTVGHEKWVSKQTVPSCDGSQLPEYTIHITIYSRLARYIYHMILINKSDLMINMRFLQSFQISWCLGLLLSGIHSWTVSSPPGRIQCFISLSMLITIQHFLLHEVTELNPRPLFLKSFTLPGQHSSPQFTCVKPPFECSIKTGPTVFRLPTVAQTYLCNSFKVWFCNKVLLFQSLHTLLLPMAPSQVKLTQWLSCERLQKTVHNFRKYFSVRDGEFSFAFFFQFTSPRQKNWLIINTCYLYQRLLLRQYFQINQSMLFKIAGQLGHSGQQ